MVTRYFPFIQDISPKLRITLKHINMSHVLLQPKQNLTFVVLLRSWCSTNDYLQLTIYFTSLIMELNKFSTDTTSSNSASPKCLLCLGNADRTFHIFSEEGVRLKVGHIIIKHFNFLQVTFSLHFLLHINIIQKLTI